MTMCNSYAVSAKVKKRKQAKEWEIIFLIAGMPSERLYSLQIMNAVQCQISCWKMIISGYIKSIIIEIFQYLSLLIIFN